METKSNNREKENAYEIVWKIKKDFKNISKLKKLVKITKLFTSKTVC